MKIFGDEFLSNKKEFSLKELNKPEDWTNLTDMAKKHTPIIEVPEKVSANDPFSVEIKIGGIDGVEHPNILGHWINWVEIYAKDRLVCRVGFGPAMCDGYALNVKVALNETTTLRARGFCNLHGVWEGKEKEVEVR